MKPLNLVCLVLSIVLTSSIGSAQESDSASVSGRVTTFHGDHLADVEVQFFELEGTRGISAKEKLVQTATTDGRGDYKVSGLPPGQYRVNVEARGFGRTEVWRFYLARKAHRVLDIGVPVGYEHGLAEITVRGQVRSATGAPLANATVTLISPYDLRENQQVRTNQKGKYKIGLIQPGQYILYVAKPGYVVRSTTVDLGNGTQSTANLMLNPIQHKPLMNP